MSRARATALVLVNWRGVFFERYLLDRHVTALEGANGAGKTTVMIAAYVVLLPDLTRLKFTNLGETGATGGDRGIYGRLGEPGPSYAALEIELDGGRRLFAAVYLERKSAPALSLTPFIITDVSAEAVAHQIFLRQSESHEHIATMADVQESAAALQAKVEVFGSAKDYFSSLFERGVSPLRLSLDEERNKFNDMLRTSMTGGISRTLTSDLRSFLFKQQTGLFDTLSRMRKNLDACRRTRLEVSEARVLEHEINGVYSAGHAMFAAALQASRRQAAEQREAAERAQQKLGEERQRREELLSLVREAESRQETLSPRLARASEAETGAREALARLARARAAAERVQHIDAERERLVPSVDEARAAHAEASVGREQARAQRDAAQQTLLRAAAGLASLQAGLEELHRQAHAHRQVLGHIDTARQTLLEIEAQADAAGHPDADTRAWLKTSLSPALEVDASGQLDPDALRPELIAEARRRLRDALAGLDRARAGRDRELQVVAQRRRDHAEARAALALICGEPVERDLAARARTELARLNELELLGTRQSELMQELSRSLQLAQRQAAIRRELAALALPDGSSAPEFMRELSAVEAQLLAAHDERREQELAVQKLEARERTARELKHAQSARADGYAKLAALAARLRASGGNVPEARADLNAALRASSDAGSALASRAAELERERQEHVALAQRCEAMGGGASAEITRLAELVDGQLLSARYEDLELEEARRVQAELGPLVDAIVVEDVGRAVTRLGSEPTPLGDVWLLRVGGAEPPSPFAALGAASSQLDGGGVAVDIGGGVRISRLPRDVSLGRAARVRQAEKARADAEAATRAIVALDKRRAEQDAVTRDLERLQEHWDLWVLGDPAEELAALERELGELAAERERASQQIRDKRLEGARLEARRDALRAILGDHHLLDPPDHAEQAEQARKRLERSRLAASELAKVAEARRVLVALVHELSNEPPDAELVERWHAQRPLLEAQRDRLFSASEALQGVGDKRAALGWQLASRALSERTELVPELEAQHDRALADANAAALVLDQAEGRWERATRENQEAEARLLAIDAHRARALGELGAEALLDLSPAAANLAEEELARHAGVREKLQREASGIEAELALARERSSEAEKRLRAAEAAAESERRASAPSDAAWEALAAAAREAGVFELDAGLPGEDASAPSAQRWLEAEGKRQLLSDRLAAARGGAELAAAIEAGRGEITDARERGARYLAGWLDVRTWLLCRLPAQIAELGEPLLGLSRLRADLTELEARLSHQEGELRGTSADVARSIEVQLRRATAQVKRLNAALDGVKFGSIFGIRVQIARVEKMDQVLRALREGETQELLFQSNLPIEEALDEIFRRHAGGRTGGHKLIDYREYLELGVQIRRRTEQEWERVNPSQVSTGEAIGIGAALMMVILAEWERDDQLLRAKRAFGSLRFLFLDEANRLSQDNLGVLFDLCEVLDLQLLIAAPEVARAEGNTTYRLVRRVSDDGQEEVLVTGRRATLPTAPDTAAPSAEAAPIEHETSALVPPPAPQPEQLGLLD